MWQSLIDALLGLLDDGPRVSLNASDWDTAWVQPDVRPLLWSGGDLWHPVSTTFTQTNLISDGSVPAQTTDPNLINPWGVSYGSVGTGGEFWISDTGTGLTSIDAVTASGVRLNLFPAVAIPSATPGSPATPTGQVYNSLLTTGAFSLSDGSPATFLFATDDGTISGWNVSAHSQAIMVVDASVNPADGALGLGAVYKGLCGFQRRCARIGAT